MYQTLYNTLFLRKLKFVIIFIAQDFLPLLPAYVNMRYVGKRMTEVCRIKVGQRMIEEANICVILTYSHHVHNPWNKVG